MKREYSEREKWFLDRIGKRIFRNETGCKCEHCQQAYKDGVLISDKSHAEYLYDLEGTFTAEGSPMRYFDTIEERDIFEKDIKHNKHDTKN